MHHYPFHIGDYRSGCIHLSQLERWVYRDLLDICYDTEQPLPLDHAVLFRLAGARTEEHQHAVLTVLSDKFVRTEIGYVNDRVQTELDKYRKKADSARNANQTRWASERDVKSDVKSDLKSDADQIPTKNQEPRTNKTHVPQGERFDEFWSAWPVSTRKVAKAACQTKWAKQKLDDVADRILAHVRVMKQTDSWKTGFEPAPLTYLNQKRWEDDLPAVQSAGKPEWMRGML